MSAGGKDYKGEGRRIGNALGLFGVLILVGLIIYGFPMIDQMDPAAAETQPLAAPAIVLPVITVSPATTTPIAPTPTTSALAISPAPAISSKPVVPIVLAVPTTTENPSPTNTPVPIPLAQPTPAAAATAATTSTSLDYDFGISLSTTLLGLSQAQLDAELDDLVSLGIGWVRMDFDWNAIQPKDNADYQWSGYDRVVKALDTRHIKILGILDYSALWAVDPSCGSVRCPPTDDAQFASFASAVATRYSAQGVHDWEIWNEPNLGGSWLPSADAAAYAKLLEAAYPAIHSADPASVVITGGLGPAADNGTDMAPIDFLSQLYAAGAGNYFDAVGFHPYSYPALPSYFAAWNAWSQMSLTDPSLRSVMTDNGDSGKEIWMTEYGAPTDGPDSNHVSEALQASMITQAISLKRSYPWAGPLFIYSYKDLGTSTDTIENFFGIIENDGTPKPAYTALKQLLSTDN